MALISALAGVHEPARSPALGAETGAEAGADAGAGAGAGAGAVVLVTERGGEHGALRKLVRPLGTVA
ncbi:hypothetical protein ACI2K4_31190 [Micromonospora sp. NPDC050397]|uniref:hypothetical protein n=1 Tax=Micromonospora sp. NPDC050397 TaxID=3364279 RepID=UPI003850C84A